MNALDRVTPWTALATRVLAPNPGPMTLDGTNSYVIRRADSPAVVIVDPGPRESDHLDRLLGQGSVALILLTHHHPDHAAGAPRLAQAASAPVRAADPALCVDAQPLRHGERIHAAGTVIEVLSTPGHTADSVCLRLPDDELSGMARASVLTGDTILGRGTTALDSVNGGRLGDYLATLASLAALGDETVLPGHGGMRDSVARVAAEYAAHRARRLSEVQAAVARLGFEDPARALTVEAITDAVYGSMPAGVRAGAEASVAAQLEYLAAAGDRSYRGRGAES